MGWHGATNTIAEAGGAGLALPGMKQLQGDIETAPSKYKGFIKRMDLGFLLRKWNNGQKLEKKNKINRF